MATLSLCMIVKDEAQKLPRCLASVKGLADEICVTDTGSGDCTPTIAQEAGAKVHFQMWADDFAKARNASLDQATGDWILVLDADETLTEQGRQLIQAIRAEQPLGNVKPEDLLMVTMMRQEVGANQSPYSQVSRLFRNHPTIQYSRPYHEGVDDSVAVLMAKEKHWQIAQFGNVAIDHTGYGVEAIAAKDKYKRAQRIMEKHHADHPQDAYMANKLGALYASAGEWKKALPLLEDALRSGNFDSNTEYELHYHLGITHKHLATIEGSEADHLLAAEKAYRKAIDAQIAGRLKLGAHLNLGALLAQKRNIDGAISQYEAAARIDPKQPVIYLNLGLMHKAKGYLEPALRAYEYAILLDPNYAAAHQNMAVVLFKLGKLPQSKQAFETAISLVQKENPAEGDRLRQGMKKLGLDKIA